ncbi:MULTISPECIES: RNase adapter RapZ [unclassified Thioalkalivibrio]|uniref:RNase adapter RapZ n=1 Tax=unclassified Thioalkalivibrio TaxID=2621013 RepID=UPI0003802E38|nr:MULTISPECIES: RNase adapter RapZ [unclassified Thioalkalivibrio]
MRLLLVSGLSGSGKTVALHTLEDAGYFCVDNLPLPLLPGLIEQVRSGDYDADEDRHLAVGVDVRSGLTALEGFADLLRELRGKGMQVEVMFLQASSEVLLRRYHLTRRRHPLARDGVPLVDAIERERDWLGHVAAEADLTVDTSRLSMHDLARTLRDRVGLLGEERLSLLFQSFGFKHGAPLDSDFVFDVRCLPNPHYERDLAPLTGRDAPVCEFLARHGEVEEMYDGIQGFLEQWVPRIRQDHRSYVTVSIGCTGGRHRSVYLVERLAAAWRGREHVTVSTRHRELSLPLESE